MTEEKNFETYLYISSNKFIVFLFETKNLSDLYKNELIYNNNNNNIDFEELNKFLNDNIFKIEKLIGRFVKDIFLIIEADNELEVSIGIKKKNDNNITNYKNLNQALIESKDLFRENYQEQNIIHMLINNYIINDKNHNEFLENMNSEYIYLDTKFITLSNNFMHKFDKILEKYQIEIRNFISSRYIKQMFNEENMELSNMAHKIRNGFNLNEILIVPKIDENKGFFEKFFQLFS